VLELAAVGALTGHYAVSARKMGWAVLKSSALLIEAGKQFDVFIRGGEQI